MTEVISHLARGESEKIGAEKLRSLMKILPESDDVSTKLNRSYICIVQLYINCTVTSVDIKEMKCGVSSTA